MEENTIEDDVVDEDLSPPPEARELLRQAILTSDAKAYCRSLMSTPDAWLFDNPATKVVGNYSDFRMNISNLIDESPNNVALVGSSKTGFSLNPDKLFKPFRTKSDVDLIIVSSDLFGEIWSALKVAYYAGHTKAIGNSDNIFRKFAILRQKKDRELLETSYLRDVNLRLQDLTRVASVKHRLRHALNFRIYATWKDAEAYHVQGIALLKERLQNGVE